MKTAGKISLGYLFLTFLKIGSISWGGFMALIAVVQNQLVDKDKIIREEMILDGISLASVLPGPLAFNVVTYVGYQLRGLKGALVSMIGILLPSFVLMLILSVGYSRYGELPVFGKFFLGVLPAITAVVLSVAVSMVQKQIKDYKQVIICVMAGITLLLVHAFYGTLVVIFTSGTLGFILYFESGRKVEETNADALTLNFKRACFFVAVFIFLVLGFWTLTTYFNPETLSHYKLLQTIFLTFSGMSVTLFGGGYVIIPAIQQVIVNGLHWLTINEFSDAIAMGQITPGPILISATFIGYHIAGFLGACVATVAIFFPPGIVMIIFSGFLDRIKKSNTITAIFKGLRPAIIGMIISSAVNIGKGAAIAWPSLAIFLVVFGLILKFRVNIVYLIPLSGLAGILLF
ncbi:MAG: chromate efflux transporter [Mariniphaga sp.]